ncbi:MAG: helix-turn-helix domain-containing protein, partial [Kiritimatiellia bacterium]
ASMTRRRQMLEARAIREALEKNGFNRLAAARELGLHKTTLFRKIKKLGITLPRQDGRTARGQPAAGDSQPADRS